MTAQKQVYKCNVCGNIVEVLHAGQGELVCCGEPMELLVEKTVDQGKEKHVPVMEATSDGVRVKVGEVPHPMEPEHYIEWIEVLTDDGIHRQYLMPGSPPEAEFTIERQGLVLREYCNVHGLWKSK